MTEITDKFSRKPEGYIFIGSHGEIRVLNENLVWKYNPEFSSSHTEPLVTMITYHKYPATTLQKKVPKGSEICNEFETILRYHTKLLKLRKVPRNP